MYMIVQEAVVAKFPQMRYLCLGGLFFLRFLSPALILPDSVGFRSSNDNRCALFPSEHSLTIFADRGETGGVAVALPPPPDGSLSQFLYVSHFYPVLKASAGLNEKSRRSLILLTKFLQNLANEMATFKEGAVTPAAHTQATDDPSRIHGTAAATARDIHSLRAQVLRPACCATSCCLFAGAAMVSPFSSQALPVSELLAVCPQTNQVTEEAYTIAIHHLNSLMQKHSDQLDWNPHLYVLHWPIISDRHSVIFFAALQDQKRWQLTWTCSCLSILPQRLRC